MMLMVDSNQKCGQVCTKRNVRCRLVLTLTKLHKTFQFRASCKCSKIYIKVTNFTKCIDFIDKKGIMLLKTICFIILVFGGAFNDLEYNRSCILPMKSTHLYLARGRVISPPLWIFSTQLSYLLHFSSFCNQPSYLLQKNIHSGYNISSSLKDLGDQLSYLLQLKINLRFPKPLMVQTTNPNFLGSSAQLG